MLTQLRVTLFNGDHVVDQDGIVNVVSLVVRKGIRLNIESHQLP